jgi:flagellar motor switch protein FliM
MSTATAPAYDLCPPGILPADQMAFAESIHRGFVQALARLLSACLEAPVSASLGGMEQKSFADFVNSRAAGACLIPLQAGARGGRAFVELSAGFVHRALGILIGTPDNALTPERAITGIEQHILQECFDSIVLALREAWAAHRIDFETLPENACQEQSAPEDSALVVNALVTLGGNAEPVRLAMPALLVRLAAMETHVPAAAPATSRPVLLDALRSAAVRVEAIVGGASLRMRDLLALEPGQVVTLGPPANCSVEFVINGQAKFRGELVVNGRNQAFQISSPIEPKTSRG